jgi:type III pantothenate kinase
LKKYLVIDLGNSRAKTGFFQGEIHPDFKVFHNHETGFLDYIKTLNPDGVLVSSTGNEEMERQIASVFNKNPVFFLDYSLIKNIQWAYPEPQNLGKDRMAAIKASVEKWPETVLCVADAGTCLTLDFMDLEGRHLGGIISPGLEMRLESMHQFTARLPRAKKEDFSAIWGNSTLSCLSSGAISGMVSEIEFHFKKLKIKYSAEAKLILTGGNAEYLAHHLNSPNFVAPNLVLEGLYFILKSLR